MYFSTLFTTVLCAATALAAPLVTPRDNDPNTLEVFQLFASPADKTTPGPIEWLPAKPSDGNMAAGGPVGWWLNKKGVDLTAFVQYERKTGVVFDTKNTIRSLFLRPDGRVYLGGGTTETSASKENVWSVSKRYNSNKEWFGVKGDTKNWVLCSGKSGYSLFYKSKAGVKGCKKLNGLEAKYHKQ